MMTFLLSSVVSIEDFFSSATNHPADYTTPRFFL